MIWIFTDMFNNFRKILKYKLFLGIFWNRKLKVFEVGLESNGTNYIVFLGYWPPIKFNWSMLSLNMRENIQVMLIS